MCNRHWLTDVAAENGNRNIKHKSDLLVVSTSINKLLKPKNKTNKTSFILTIMTAGFGLMSSTKEINIKKIHILVPFYLPEESKIWLRNRTENFQMLNF
jgi:hypothetical protein